MILAGKKVAVLGAGGSGIAAATLALSHGASVAAFDSGNVDKLKPAVSRFEEIGVALTCGDSALSPASQFDVTVISPGIDTAWPIAQAFERVSGELIGEIELAYRLTDIPIVAITGTNGKTTTTSLVEEMLVSSGVRAVAAGNIGLAFSEVVGSGESYDWIVLELSSFQLETIKSFSPEIGVWMNFAPDHMDRYGSLDEYREAKLRLFENWGDEKAAICKLEDGLRPSPDTVTFSAFSDGGDFSFANGKVVHSASGREFDFSSAELQGRHNAENVMVALAVADQLGLSWERVGSSIAAFRAPAHRCEKVGVVNDVTYLNDSKSTNLHSLESALAGQELPVVLVAGGKDKGLDYSSLAELASESVTTCICIGEIAGEIAGAWGGLIPCRVAESIPEAVALAAAVAAEGDTVLFSPGTSSFDMFSGYEARGDAFREAVAKL